ncbi:MAG: stage II sporulation protein R [Clostridia bacterium]|nr:stage II sporulation protein R [Clostridia bacterium]
MKKVIIFFSAFVCLTAILFPLLPLQGEAEVYDNAIRLHVLANSDSEDDQALKIKVRDAVLELVSEEITDCTSRYEAECKVEDICDNIAIAAQNKIYEEGYDYSVRVTLDNEYYPTREYEGVRMPSGTYMSLRVLIGDAEGQNWWCVLYPPLCTGTAKPKTTLKQAGFTPEQIRVLTEGESPKYKVKFKILEIFGSLTK